MILVLLTPVGGFDQFGKKSLQPSWVWLKTAKSSLHLNYLFRALSLFYCDKRGNQSEEILEVKPDQLPSANTHPPNSLPIPFFLFLSATSFLIDCLMPSYIFEYFKHSGVVTFKFLPWKVNKNRILISRKISNRSIHDKFIPNNFFLLSKNSKSGTSVINLPSVSFD